VRGLAGYDGEALGHECIAEVIEIGEHVATVAPGAPGARVLGAAQISCGVCRTDSHD
jgi:threonine dehydrogenase-like Zn-dependent dehydrogenase